MVQQPNCSKDGTQQPQQREQKKQPVTKQLSTTNQSQNSRSVKHPSSKLTVSSQIMTNQVVFYYLQLTWGFLLEPLIITLLWEYYLPTTSLLVRLFAQDNLYSSSRYLLANLGVPWMSSSTEGYSSTFLTVNYLSKWTFFLLMVIIYWLGQLLTWGYYPETFFYYLIIFLGSPASVFLILNENLCILSELEQTRKRLINYLVCLVLSKTLNFICLQNLQMDPQIQTEELQQSLFVQDFKYILDFIQAFLLTSVIKYLKNKDNRLYGWLGKILYQWRTTLIKVPSNHRSMIVEEKALHPRETISEIIRGRKWHYLYDPTVLILILRIYSEQEGDFLNQLMTDLYSRSCRWMAIWSLAQVIPIPILALAFRLRHPFPYNLVIPALDTLLLVNYPDRLFLISFWSEFGDYLNNSITQNFSCRLGSYYLIIQERLTRVTKYNFYLLISIVMVYQLAHSSVRYLLLLLPFCGKYNFIYIWLVIFGFFSNYQLYHLITLNTLIYLGLNIYFGRTKQQPDLSIQMVQSYHRHDN